MDRVINISFSNIQATAFTVNYSQSAATSFVIDVATDESFTNKVVNGATTTDSFYSATGLTIDTKYFVRIKAINDVPEESSWSYTNSVITGMHVSGFAIEPKPAISADILTVSGFSIEVLTDFNLQLILRDTTGTAIADAKCLIVNKTWNYKGDWNPADAAPANNAGDYYTISAQAETAITGESEIFETSDLLYCDGTNYIRKVKRNVVSNAEGIANMYTDYETDMLLTVEKTGKQTEKQLLRFVSGRHVYPLTLYPQVAAIITQSGHAINTRPKDRVSKVFQ
jgi:hypothetical protein